MAGHKHHHSPSVPAPEQGKSPEQGESWFTVSRVLTGLAIGAGVVGVGIMLAPHILPALGASSPDLAEEAALMIHNEPTGMAGAINSTMALIPGIGSRLAAGGLFTAAASALTGIGGVMLGNFIASREDGSKSIKWGTVIKYGALITSALIAMPAILTALGTGIIYCGMALSEAGILTTAASNSLIANVASTIGSVGGTYAHNLFGLQGIGAVLPHLVCCGAPLAPTILPLFSWLFTGKKTSRKEVEAAKECQPYSPQKYSDGSIIGRIRTDQPLQAGKPCNAGLILTHRNGQPLTSEELAIVHTEKLHLFVADSSLKDYHHIHPQPTGQPGVLAFSFTPNSSSNYMAWADFTLLKDGQNHRLRMEMPSMADRNIPPSIRANSRAEQDGLRFEWISDPLQQNAETIVEVRITDASNKPVTDLQPVMGAFAHLVGFSADGQSIIHTHPLGGETTDPAARGGPDMLFHVEPDCSGATQFYLQVRRNDEDVYVPFGQHIKQPALATEQLSAAQNSAPGHVGMR